MEDVLRSKVIVDTIIFKSFEIIFKIKIFKIILLIVHFQGFEIKQDKVIYSGYTKNIYLTYSFLLWDTT